LLHSLIHGVGMTLVCRVVHHKCYLPNEEGYYEATWYDRYPIKQFEVFQVQKEKVTCGMQICTDLWFMENPRHFARKKAHLILNPRATPPSTLEKWLVGGI